MTVSDWMKLSGIAIIVIGLALRLRPAPVVVVAALVTGLASGLPLVSNSTHEGVIDLLGRAFADNRLVTLFIVTLPAVGLAERYGLQERAAELIRQVASATVGRLQSVYQVLRVLMGILGIRLNGHPAFVRPLILPMSLGAAAKMLRRDKAEQIPPPDVEVIKASAAAAENYGNFYGQNLSPVQPGVLLVFGVMKGLGYSAGVWSLVLFAIPIATISVIMGMIQFWLLDRRLRKEVTA